MARALPGALPTTTDSKRAGRFYHDLLDPQGRCSMSGHENNLAGASRAVQRVASVSSSTTASPHRRRPHPGGGSGTPPLGGTAFFAAASSDMPPPRPRSMEEINQGVSGGARLVECLLNHRNDVGYLSVCLSVSRCHGVAGLPRGEWKRRR